MFVRYIYLFLFIILLNSCIKLQGVGALKGSGDSAIDSVSVATMYKEASDKLNTFEPLGEQYIGYFANDRVFFDENSSIINKVNQEILKKQIKWLQNNQVDILLKSYSSGIGSRDYKLAVSERRVASVKNYLLSFGVSPKRIKVVSYGKNYPMSAPLGSDLEAESRVVITHIAN